MSSSIAQSFERAPGFLTASPLRIVLFCSLIRGVTSSIALLPSCPLRTHPLLHTNIRISPPIMLPRDKACNAVQLATGHTFSNNNLLLEALDTTGMRTAESNQRLALLGDALLKTVLLDTWYAGGTAKGLLAP